MNPPRRTMNPPTQTDRGRRLALMAALTFKKSFKNPHDFNIFAFRPHQAPTYTHHTCHLRSYSSIFHFPTTFFIIFLKMSSPPIQEAQFRILTQSIFNETSHFFDVEKPQIEPVLVMVFGRIALSFAPFPFYPPRASQAGPQKTLQICLFLLHVASMGDFNDVSNILLMTSPCIRPHFGDILTSPT